MLFGVLRNLLQRPRDHQTGTSGLHGVRAVLILGLGEEQGQLILHQQVLGRHIQIRDQHEDLPGRFLASGTVRIGFHIHHGISLDIGVGGDRSDSGPI